MQIPYEFLLGGFASLATIFLVLGNVATKAAIQQRQQEDLSVALLAQL